MSNSINMACADAVLNLVQHFVDADWADLLRILQWEYVPFLCNFVNELYKNSLVISKPAIIKEKEPCAMFMIHTHKYELRLELWV